MKGKKSAKQDIPNIVIGKYTRSPKTQRNYTQKFILHIIIV